MILAAFSSVSRPENPTAADRPPTARTCPISDFWSNFVCFGFKSHLLGYRAVGRAVGGGRRRRRSAGARAGGRLSPAAKGILFPIIIGDHVFLFPIHFLKQVGVTKHECIEVRTLGHVMVHKSNIALLIRGLLVILSLLDVQWFCFTQCA